MDDGRSHTFGPEDLAADRLAHGYATTVHRSQGATCDTTHLFADGGGRELGYVGMSRARQTSHVHVVVDNLGQAVEDLAREWNAERRQVWAIDTGTPDVNPVGVHPLEIEAAKTLPDRMRAALSRARFSAERQALATAAIEGDIDLPAAVDRVRELDRHIARLDRHLNPSQPFDPWAPSTSPAPARPEPPSLTPSL